MSKSTESNHHPGITRRETLKAGLGTSLGAAALTMAPSLATAAKKRGGHAFVLNDAYPDVWDPHIAGTLGALASISPLYNQVVEFNPLKPDEVIGDLAKGWDVVGDRAKICRGLPVAGHFPQPGRECRRVRF